MGVPRLAHLLEPYGQNISLGCHRQHAQCQYHMPTYGAGKPSPDLSARKVIIDGPAMVHFVYNRLLTLSHHALPSYSRLGEAVVRFLAGLEGYGLEIAVIYFDGVLPESKRPIRLARLESSASRLAKLKTTHPQGFSQPCSTEGSGSDESLNLDALLDSFRAPPPGLSSWPIPPFIIPACLDHLKTSCFAPVVDTVPGEADVFCATHALQHGGLVLSGDSDLLVHDLGPNGAYIPFGNLALGVCSEGSNDNVSLLRGRIYRRSEIAQHLQTRDMVRVAFEIGEDPHITLATAVQRARQGLLPTETLRFESFKAMYEALPPASRAKAAFETSALRSLDPRVAEFVWQVENTTSTSDAIHVYLPLLFEDPARVSAWAVGAEVRDMAYNAAMSSRNTEFPVVEMMRSGPKRIAGRNVSSYGTRQLTSNDQQWRDRWDELRGLSPGASDHALWVAFALIEVCAWYVRSGRSSPHTNHLRIILSNRGQMGPCRSWYEIHLDAQFQAAVYSFRILQQILQRCAGLLEGLEELSDRVQQMPPLVAMLEGQWEADDVDTVIDLVMRVAQGEDHERMSGHRPPPKGSNTANAETSQPVEPKGKNRRKKSTSGDQPHRAQLEEAIRSRNMYNVLGSRNA